VGSAGMLGEPTFSFDAAGTEILPLIDCTLLEGEAIPLAPAIDILLFLRRFSMVQSNNNL
jgi:hypothetical protein